MAWIYLNDIDLVNGSQTVEVRDNLDQYRVQGGWALVYQPTASAQRTIVEIADATPFNLATGTSTFILAAPWALATATGVSAQVMPVTAPLVELMRVFEEKAEQVNAVAGILPSFSDVNAGWGVSVNDEGDGLRLLPRLLWLNQLRVAGRTRFQSQSNATTLEELRDDFNRLLSQMKVDYTMDPAAVAESVLILEDDGFLLLSDGTSFLKLERSL